MGVFKRCAGFIHKKPDDEDSEEEEELDEGGTLYTIF